MLDLSKRTRLLSTQLRTRNNRAIEIANENWPELRCFDGDAHNAEVEKFKGLDRARTALVQERIVSGHAAGGPHGAAGGPD